MLREFLDKIKPNFEKGGRFAKLHSTFDAFETFLFVPNKVTKLGAHIRDSMDMKRAMVIVVMALIPALLFGIYNVGYQHFLSVGMQTDFWQIFLYGLSKVLPMLVVSYVVGLGIEFAFAQARGHEVNEGFLVSGMLIPLISPPDTPLWMLALATAFAVIIGKEVFGGTGMNIWNPALIARAFLFFAYPAQISGDKVWIAEKADAYSGATALSKLGSGQVDILPSLQDMFWGFMPGSVGETSKFCILLGAIILLWTGVANFRVMISVILGGAGMTLLLNVCAGSEPGVMHITPLYQLMMGGFLFGAVFMATDPVSSAQTNTGKLIYGFLTGVLAILIRVFNPAYPEGMMLAILFMNTFAPLIDYTVVQRNIKRREKRALRELSAQNK